MLLFDACMLHIISKTRLIVCMHLVVYQLLCRPLVQSPSTILRNSTAYRIASDTPD